MRFFLVVVLVAGVALPAGIYFWREVVWDDGAAEVTLAGEAHVAAGEAALKEERCGEAIAAFDRARAVRKMDEALQLDIMKARLCFVSVNPGVINADNVSGIVYDANYLLEHAPGDMDAVYLVARGHAEVRLGQRDEAVESYTLASERRPDHPAAFTALGQLYASEPDGYEKAKANFEKALDAMPENRAAHIGLGQLYMSKGLTDEASKSLEAAVKIRDGFDVRMLLGQAKLDKQDFEAAVQNFAAAARLNPNEPSALRNLGEAHLAARQPVEAERALKAAINIRPDLKSGTALGFALAAQKKFKEALNVFDQVLKQDDSHFMAVWGAATTADGLPDQKLALRLYKRLLQLDGAEEAPELVEKIKGEAKKRVEALEGGGGKETPAPPASPQTPEEGAVPAPNLPEGAAPVAPAPAPATPQGAAPVMPTP